MGHDVQHSERKLLRGQTTLRGLWLNRWRWKKKLVHAEILGARLVARTIEGEDESRQVIWNNSKKIIDLFHIDWLVTKSVFSRGCFIARCYPRLAGPPLSRASCLWLPLASLERGRHQPFRIISEAWRDELIKGSVMRRRCRQPHLSPGCFGVAHSTPTQPTWCAVSS